MSELKLERRFDVQRKRHYLNDVLTVLHCHHYATLFTQLAIDAQEIVDGTKILRETSEDVTHQLLGQYYTKFAVSDAKERLDVASKMYSAMGLGKLTPVSASVDGGEVEIAHAHVDEGWLKKWGKHSTPVNFIGAGFIAGMFAASYDKPARTYQTAEKQSIVSGAGKSSFVVTK